MNLCVFGANGPTGRLVVERAVRAGHVVTACTRHPDEFPRGGPALRVCGCDVTDAGAVLAAVAGQDAVVSTLGARFTKRPVQVCAVGATNIVAAMAASGVDRLIAVTSSAVEAGPATGGGVLFRKVIQPYVVNHLGRTVYEDPSPNFCGKAPRASTMPGPG